MRVLSGLFHLSMLFAGLWLISLNSVAQPAMPTLGPARFGQKYSPVVSADSAAGDSAYSELTLSLSGSSRSFYLAREFGNKAFSLEPEIIYSHKSGVYAGVSGFYLGQGDAPRYAFTDIAVGYDGEFTSRWSYSVALDRLYFTPAQRNNAETAPIRNGFDAYTAYRVGPITLGADYNYFFGGKTAHVLTATISTAFEKKRWHGFDKVTLEPYLDVFFSTSNALLRYGGLYQGVRPDQLLTARQRKKAQASQTVQADKLRLMGSELVIPVAVSLRAFTLMLAGHAVLPIRFPDETTPLPVVVYGQLSVGYSIR